MSADEVRIQKAIADAGVMSRRAAEELVAAGRVTVNDVPATIGQRVSSVDRIAIDGRAIGTRTTTAYLAMHKPAGVTSTVADRHAERTVIELLPPAVRDRVGRVYPVGRLDRDSEGLLLLTNDGDWAQRVLHPRHAVDREYATAVAAPLAPDQVASLLHGVGLEEGLARVVAIRQQTTTETRRLLAVIDGQRQRRHLVWYRVVLTQGWKRQIRRMFREVDAPVERLVRVRIGAVRLGELAPGTVRDLTASERDRLAPGARSPRAGAPTPTEAGDAAVRRPLVVAIDGPGSSGKSTVGAGAAASLGYRFFDTGLLYRGLAWLASERGVDPADTLGLLALVPAMHLADDGTGRLSRVIVDGMDVTDSLHAGVVDRIVSVVAQVPEVRAALLQAQRDIAHADATTGIVMAGRDIGSVVLPDADLKLYLDVSLDERARRRTQQRGLAPDGAEARRIREDLARRDTIDSSRTTAPLTRTEDALVITTDGHTLDQTIGLVVERIRAAEVAHAAPGDRA